MRRFISIDPGMSTGWAIWEQVEPWEPFHRVNVAQSPGGLPGFLAADVFNRRRSLDWVVCERFIPDGRASGLEQFEPLRIEGFIEGCFKGAIRWQRNAEMSGVSDRLLKQHGLWLTGKDVGQPDANDAISATKHGLAYLKARHRPSQEYYWRED